MSLDFFLLIIVIIAGFYMAWSIGANDVANAMGTSVGSGALTLRKAVCIAAVLEFSGAFFFGSHVSTTIQSGIVNLPMFGEDYHLVIYGMLSALLASGAWLQLASYYGWPVSTTHSIVGAMIGFGIVAGGLEAIYWSNVGYIVTSWVISPLLGGILSFMIFHILRRTIFFTRHPLHSAKRMTPFLVFIVVIVLCLILLLKGIQSSLDNEYVFFISVGVALFAALISWLFIRNISVPESIEPIRPTYEPEISKDLEKAKSYLQRIPKTENSSLNYKISLMLEEMNHLTLAMKKRVSTEIENDQFKAIEKIFGYLQILSACLMAFAHGANDVANAIGPLAAALSVIDAHSLVVQTQTPLWLLAWGGFGIVIGLATWGWRVIETIGKKITELTPSRGFAAEFGAAATILVASRLGLPISTTHTLVGSVLGVGLARGLEALDMSTTRDIVISWIVTVPAGAVASMIFFSCFRYLLGA